MEGRISFIIAYRLSTIRNADLILVMNNMILSKVVLMINHYYRTDFMNFIIVNLTKCVK